jgi:FkbM family methyltransferase
MKAILKTFYDVIPFKKEAFIILKKVWQPKQYIYQHLHFKGVFKVKISEDAGFKIRHYGFEVENEIFWSGITGNWERVSLGLWLQLCRNADIIFDLGANTGVYSLLAKAVNPRSKVYAIEPVKRVFQRLKENIALNKFDIVAIEKAVSNKNGTATIYDTDTEHTYSVTVNKNLNPEEIKVIKTEIKTITLDSFIEENKIGKIDLMKIDVETHEPEVLEGFAVYMKLYRPSIIIEVIREEIAERINELVNGLGYLYFNIDERAGIRRVDKISRSDFYNYLLCSEETAKNLSLI